MKITYNWLKLTEHRELFLTKKVLVIGGGAVGSYMMEYLARLGVSPVVLDFDIFTAENAAKSSSLIRVPEDVGKNKAKAAANRVAVLLEEGCITNGIDAEVAKLGPEAYAGFDAVLIAVDNYAAKILINQSVRQLPPERRPVVIMAGTFGELAASVITDNTKFCLRCTMDEKWMGMADVHTSCADAMTREENGVQEIVRTSNLASSLAAHWAVEQLRAYVRGFDAVNHSMEYTPYPVLELSESNPVPKANCPDCKIHPPKILLPLSGSVLSKTLRGALEEIREKLGTDDFEMMVHQMSLSGRIYTKYVVTDICHSCGIPLDVHKHEGRLFKTDLMCPACKAKQYNPELHAENGIVLCGFDKSSTPELMGKTLYELGFPLGGHIEVFRRETMQTTVFYCEEDAAQMLMIQHL